MANESPKEIIVRYLQDAIAAESNFESQLRSFAAKGSQVYAQQLFEQHADETVRQRQRLTARLKDMGETPSGIKSFMAHLFGFAPVAAQIGHDPAEQNTQDLIIAYSVENSEVAMYEAMARVAAAAGDKVTERLARQIQDEERLTAEKVWNLIPRSARDAFSKASGEKVAGGGAAA